jgi:hypothetical protein
MKAHVDGTSFGRITIGGRVYTHDVVLTPAGQVADRWTVLANPAGSHVLAEEDAEYLAAQGAARVIVGTGQYGALRLSEDAEACFRQHGCEVTVAPTPEAIALYNAATEPVTGMFHLTC